MSARPARRRHSADRLRPRRQPTYSQPSSAAERGGVGFFLEPELAHARLDGHRAPRAERYGQAVLGRGPCLSSALEFALPPLLAGETRHAPADRRRGTNHVPRTRPAPSLAVEVVLDAPSRSIPAQRFASMADFAAGVPCRPARSIRRRRAAARAPIRSSRGGETLMRHSLARAELGSAETVLWRDGIGHLARAGRANGLLRVARAREDPGLLALADAWSQRASRSSAKQRAPSHSPGARHHFGDGWPVVAVPHAQRRALGARLREPTPWPTWSGSTRPSRRRLRIAGPEREPRPHSRPCRDPPRVQQPDRPRGVQRSSRRSLPRE